MKLERNFCALVAAAVALGAGTVWGQQDDDQETSNAANGESQRDLILAERREELIREADQALEQLRRQDELAAELLEQAYGHAVLNMTKGGLIVTGAGGTGVARTSDGDDVTFMRLGSAGIGLGAGFANYKLVLLFADEAVYSSFVSGQWDGALSAQAAAGTEGVSAEEQFLGGVRAFRLTDGGLMAQLDVTALRFWPYDRLNRAAEVEQQIVAAAQGDVPAEIEERVAAAETAPDAQSDADSDSASQAQPEPSNPERLDELAAERDDLDVFVAAVRAAGLADALTGDTEYTVFAPTDEAFESMSGMTQEELLAPENREELVRLLRAHIVADDLDRQMASDIPEARTIDGGTVSVNVEGEQFTVGNASVVEPDLQRGNLRVHVVDDLLASPIRVAVAEPDDAQADDAGGASQSEAAELEAAQQDAQQPSEAQPNGSAQPSEQPGGEGAVVEPGEPSGADEPNDASGSNEPVEPNVQDEIGDASERL